MKRAELVELLKLTGWSQAELGRRLELSNAAVSRWLTGERSPTGPARILMRQWLDSARENTEEQKQKLVSV
jgi:transcriptional regulator with XRE-family HTH domain